MSAPTATVERRSQRGYCHEALLYRGNDEFLDGTLAFARDAVNAGEPILVAVSRSKIDLIRSELGEGGGAVSFVDMAEVGRNPGLIIAAWHAFVAEQSGTARPVRGIGEPIYVGRSAPEIAECQLHEDLLNVAFDAQTPFWLLCPYDVESLGPELIDRARTCHPYVAHGTERDACSRYEPIDPAEVFDRHLPATPPDVAQLAFSRGDLGEMRAFVAAHARRAGLDGDRTVELVLAINELATNSIQHGGGSGTVRTWLDSGAVVFEIADNGHITTPLAGRLPPAPHSEGGRGLWIANQVCDLVQIQSSSTSGSLVRVHMRLSSSNRT